MFAAFSIILSICSLIFFSVTISRQNYSTLWRAMEWSFGDYSNINHSNWWLIKMMSNRISNLCLTNLCRRNISNTILSLQRKKKFTKAQVGFWKSRETFLLNRSNQVRNSVWPRFNQFSNHLKAYCEIIGTWVSCNSRERYRMGLGMVDIVKIYYRR